MISSGLMKSRSSRASQGGRFGHDGVHTQDGSGGRRLARASGAGLDRIDRSALPPGTWLANVYGHEIGGRVW